MSNLRPPQIKKKLVMISAKDNTAFSDWYPPINYASSSKTNKTSLTLSLPSYPENLVFYENFQDHALTPFVLSFVCVVGDNSGKVFHDFGEYKNVGCCGFSHNLESVRAAFEIVSQIHNCEEIQFHFDQKSILLTKNDQTIRSRDVSGFPLCPSIKSVKLTLDDQLKKEVCTEPTRIHDVFIHLRHCCPNLESVKMVIFDVDFAYVKQLLDDKRLSDGHKITVKKGKCLCDPESRRPVSSHPNPFLPHKGGNIQQAGTVKPPNAIIMPKMKNNGILETAKNPDRPTTKPIPLLPKVEASQDENKSTPLVESPAGSSSSTSYEEEDDDLKVGKPRPVKTKVIDLVDISSSEDEHEQKKSPKKKKIKLEKKGSQSQGLVAPKNSSLASLATYKQCDWEEDSEEELEKQKVKDDSIALAKAIDFDLGLVKEALITVNALEEFSPVSTNSSLGIASSPKNGFIEGVHFERPSRSRPSPSKHRDNPKDPRTRRF